MQRTLTAGIVTWIGAGRMASKASASVATASSLGSMTARSVLVRVETRGGWRRRERLA